MKRHFNFFHTIHFLPFAIFFLLASGLLYPQTLLERLKKDDANGDGAVTREEFRGPPEIFNRLDANGNGVIDAGEMNRAAGQGRPQTRPQVDTQNLEFIKDIAYGQESRAQKCDVLKSKEGTAGPAPLVLFIHGGGWKSGDKAPFPPLLKTLAEQGFVCATVNYRLSGEAKFPAAVEDCKRALRFLRANSHTYGLDPKRVGVWGTSAGGHLAALLGTSGGQGSFAATGPHTNESDRVQAVCDFFGPTDFQKMKGHPSKIDHMGERSPEAEFLGGAVESVPDVVRRANPLTYIGPNTPPFLIMHGNQDEVVPMNQSQILFEALQKNAVSSRLIVVTNGGHGFSGPEIDREVVSFFKQTLGSMTPENYQIPPKASGTAPSPRGIFVSGPPASSRSSSVVPALTSKNFVDGFLVRIGWKDLEPSPGQYDWSLLNREMEAAKKCGKKVALGIVNGPHAPAWLAASGVPQVEISARGRTSMIPVPWDPKYLSLWTNFIAQLGPQVWEHPSLALVHVTTSTLNGFEMPLAFTPDEERAWKGLGYDPTKHLSSWKTVIQAFVAAFPSTPLDVEVHPVFRDDTLAQGVADFGLGLAPGRFGIFAAWWSHRNTQVYSGSFAVLKEGARRGFASAQMVASQSPNRFGPAGGMGEGGLATAFDTGLASGIRYFEVWETDLQNPELESLFISTRTKCLE